MYPSECNEENLFFFNDTATTEIYTLSLHDGSSDLAGDPRASGERLIGSSCIPTPPQPSSDCSGVSRSAQPNVPGRGILASYSLRFWAMVLLVGLGAGLGGAALLELLGAVQHLVWDYHSGEFLAAVERASSAHRVLALT